MVVRKLIVQNKVLLQTTVKTRRQKKLYKAEDTPGYI